LLQQLAARVKSLNEANPEESILSDPIPWELPADLNGPRITLNRKAVEPRKCFVHRCLNKARCAFSFRLEFPMEVGADIISYEVNTTILYFPAREGAPDFDERLTKTFDSKQTFAFWNGKLMFNHEIDFINEYAANRHIDFLLSSAYLFFRPVGSLKPKSVHCWTSNAVSASLCTFLALSSQSKIRKESTTERHCRSTARWPAI
jgi:hypothetical protein